MTHRKTSLLLLATISVGGCASNPTVIADPRPFCKAVQPVCIVKDDNLTESTASKLLANEYGRETVCGKAPKCKSEKPTS